MGSLIYILYTRVYLCFGVYKLLWEFVTLVEIYLGQKNLVLNYYDKIEDAPISDLLRQACIKTDNQLIIFSDSIWYDFLYIRRSTGAYIVVYQGETIDHFTYVPYPVS